MRAQNAQLAIRPATEPDRVSAGEWITGTGDRYAVQATICSSPRHRLLLFQHRWLRENCCAAVYSTAYSFIVGLLAFRLSPGALRLSFLHACMD